MTPSPRDPRAAHRAYWSTPQVMAPFAVDQPSFRWYEEFLVAQVAPVLAARFGQVRRIHVVGCGSGREIPRLLATFPTAAVVASDISAEMVALCRRNLERWQCADAVELQCCAASAISHKASAELATVFDNVLTYVAPAAERLTTLQGIRKLLVPGAFVIGVVHHRWGRISKTAYFAAQAALHSLGLAAADPGDRTGGDHGHRVPFHYFTRAELATLLANAGLHTLAIRSVAEVARILGRRYSAWTGSNNLVFMAQA